MMPSASAGLRKRFGLCAMAATMVWLQLACPARADSVRGVRPAVTNVAALRDGVLMVPLTSQRPGDNWPRTLAIRLADGRRLVGDVAWIAPLPEFNPSTAASWTADVRTLMIRSIERTDDTSKPFHPEAGCGPYVIVRLPESGDGAIRIEDHQLAARWHDVPWSDPLRSEHDRPIDGAMPMEEAPDRPDARSPFEYWRWVLLADRLGLRPPAPAGEPLEQLAAEHYASLWRLGLSRLAALSPRVAGEVRSMLTRTAVDRARIAATWIADPQEIAALLAAIVDYSRPDEQALTAAVEWLEQQPAFTVWPEDESGDQVRLALTSHRDHAITMRLGWLGDGRPPTSLQLESGIIAHVTMDRMPMQQAGLIGDRLIEPSMQILRIEGGATQVDIPCGVRVVEARPPGVSFRPLNPPLTLADAQASRASVVVPDRATLTQIRRVGGRWEVFFECGRVFEQRQTINRDAIRTLDDLRGIEAITLLIGKDDEGADFIWLTIAEHDWPALIRGRESADLQVHRRSFSDRWNCRIVLPEEWFSSAYVNPAYVAFVRSHGDTRDLETGPAASPAWRIDTGRVAIDLSQWDDLPREGR